MTIRNKIVLWIVGAGSLTSLLFSIAVFVEMVEQPYDLLDAELKQTAGAVVRQLQENRGAVTPDKLDWIRVFGPDGEMIYASPFADRLKLDVHPEHNGKTLRRTIPVTEARALSIDHLKKNASVVDIPFRIRSLAIEAGSSVYRVDVARPMVHLDEEIGDLFWSVSLGWIVSVLVLFGLSLFVARQILKPVSEIHRLAREIDENTLSKRIPLGKSRDELYVLSQSLNSMFDRLQFSFQQQKQFLASASHELKSPIAILRLSIEQAQQQDDLPEWYKIQLADQSHILLHIDRLVKTLLTLSRLEHNTTIRRIPFDLAFLIRRIMKDFELTIAQRQMILFEDLPETLQIEGDPDKLTQMLVNLVDNAINYGRDGGELRVQASAGDDDVCLTLFNTGKGIPRDELERVFEPFYRVEKSRSQRYGGTGLGLSIVYQIVKLHRGTIVMESEPGAWTRVRITLPQ